MKQKDGDAPITQNDLKLFMKDFAVGFRKDLIKDIEAMFNIFGQMIFERFDMQDAEQAKKADKADIARLENKLDATIDRVDDHEGRLKKLETKAAS